MLATVALLLAPLGAAAAAAAAAAARPRHAVILLIDDLGYGDTGHMGAEYPTPAIDGLALGGVRLNQSCELTFRPRPPPHPPLTQR